MKRLHLFVLAAVAAAGSTSLLAQMTAEEANALGQQMGRQTALPDSDPDGHYDFENVQAGQRGRDPGRVVYQSSNTTTARFFCDPSRSEKATFTAHDSHYTVEECYLDGNGEPISADFSVCDATIQDQAECDGSTPHLTRDVFTLNRGGASHLRSKSAEDGQREWTYTFVDCIGLRCSMEVAYSVEQDLDQDDANARAEARNEAGGNNGMREAHPRNDEDPQRDYYTERSRNLYSDCMSSTHAGVGEAGEARDCDGNMVTTLGAPGTCYEECTEYQTVTYTDAFQCIDRVSTATDSCTSTVGYDSQSCDGSSGTNSSSSCSQTLEYDQINCQTREESSTQVWTCPAGVSEDNTEYDPSGNICGFLPQCPEGTTFDGEQCRSDLPGCSGGGASQSGISATSVSSDFAYTYNDGRFTIGTPGNNYYNGGSCSVFSGSFNFTFNAPGRVQSLKLRRVAWDDHIIVKVNGTIAYSGPNPGTDVLIPAAGGTIQWQLAPPRTDGCERRRSWDTGFVDIDVTHLLSPNGENEIYIETGVGGGGEMFTEWELVEADCLFPAPCNVSNGFCREPGVHEGTGSTTAAPEDGTYGQCQLEASAYIASNNTIEHRFDCASVSTATCPSLPATARLMSREPFDFDADGNPTAWDEVYFDNMRFTPPCPSPSEGCFDAGTTCTDSSARQIQGGMLTHTVNPGCWVQEKTTTCGGECEGRSELSNCTYTGFTCFEDDPQMQSPDPHYGTCTKWRDEWSCPSGEVRQCNYANSGECGDVTSRTCVRYDNDGNCVEYNETRECQTNEPSNCRNRYDAGCVEVARQCNRFDGGVCVEYEYSYECERTRQECSQTESTCSAVPFSSEDRTNNDYTSAAQAFAVIDAADRAMEAVGNPPTIRLFQGEAHRCSDPDENIGTLRNECCETPPQDGWFLNQACSESEVQLSSARVAGRAAYVDRRCINKDDVFGCLTYGEYYCVFDNMLSRLIQEQGRAQLAQMASSSSATKSTGTLSFPLTRPDADAGWSPVVEVDGVRFMGYSWEESCSSDSRSSYIDCPSGPKDVYIAVCETGASNCPELQSDPRSGAGYTDWRIQLLDHTKRQTEATSTASVVSGQCTNNNCTYQLDVWPTGDAGNSTKLVDYTWPLYSADGGFDEGSSGFGAWRLRGQVLPLGTPMPSTIAIEVTDTGTGATQTFNVPTNQQGTNFELATNPPMTIFGECHESVQFCRYQVRVPTSVQPKPWVTEGGPITTAKMDCSGFTLEQFAALDLDEMDLSEWEAAATSANPNNATPPPSAEDARNAVAAHESDVQNNRTRNVDPRETVARISPTSGISPWTTTLEAASRYPRPGGDENDYDTVELVEVNWGDGQTSAVDRVDTRTGGYRLTHTYDNGENGPSRDYNIVITFHLATGAVRQVNGRVRTHRASEGPPADNQSYGVQGDSNQSNRPADQYQQGNRPPPPGGG